MAIPLRDKSTCKYDQISLGEVMLRLDPGEGRIRTARNFQVWEGGGEYNTSRGLRKCFNYKTAVVTAFVAMTRGYLRTALVPITTWAKCCAPAAERSGVMARA